MSTSKPLCKIILQGQKKNNNHPSTAPPCLQILSLCVNPEATTHQLLMKKGEQRSPSHLSLSLSGSGSLSVSLSVCLSVCLCLSLSLSLARSPSSSPSSFFWFFPTRATSKHHQRPDTLLSVPHKASRYLQLWRAGKGALLGVNCPVTSALCPRRKSGASKTSSSHFRCSVN